VTYPDLPISVCTPAKRARAGPSLPLSVLLLSTVTSLANRKFLTFYSVLGPVASIFRFLMGGDQLVT
jgi:hypothetical protein